MIRATLIDIESGIATVKLDDGEYLDFPVNQIVVNRRENEALIYEDQLENGTALGNDNGYSNYGYSASDLLGRDEFGEFHDFE